MTEFGLTDETLTHICSVFRQFPQVDEVRIFGSRAKGTERANSDIDLALYGEIDQRLVGRITSALDELPLPYIFDVKAYAHISHPPFKTHIDRYGTVLYSRDQGQK
jgi:predicted nucleotidyltransferase